MGNDLRSSLIAGAKSLPDLVRKADTLDPQLASALRGKSLLAARSPPVVLLAGALTWAAGHWGLGWDPEFTSMLAGAAVLGAGYVMRMFTSAPVTGFARAAALPEEASPEAPRRKGDGL